jgi:hypothetical protein
MEISSFPSIGQRYTHLWAMQDLHAALSDRYQRVGLDYSDHLTRNCMDGREISISLEDGRRTDLVFIRYMQHYMQHQLRYYLQ